jgi:hypothetical protein
LEETEGGQWFVRRSLQLATFVCFCLKILNPKNLYRRQRRERRDGTTQLSHPIIQKFKIEECVRSSSVPFVTFCEKSFWSWISQGVGDPALGVLEMGRLKPRDRRFYVVRPGDPTFFKGRRRPMIAATAGENILQKATKRTKGWNNSVITSYYPKIQNRRMRA